MLLHDNKRSPSPRRVRIFLAEKGVEMPSVDVSIGKGEVLTPEFKKLNPWCTLPVLELNSGLGISEASAVCRYLEARYPAPPLFGVGPEDIGMVEMWNHRIEIDGFIPVAEVLRNGVPRLEGRALTGAEDYDQIPALVERGKKRLAHFGDLLDQQLSEQEHVAGPSFTIADITLLVVLDFASVAGVELRATRSHLARWYEQVAARPSATA